MRFFKRLLTKFLLFCFRGIERSTNTEINNDEPQNISQLQHMHQQYQKINNLGPTYNCTIAAQPKATTDDKTLNDVISRDPSHGLAENECLSLSPARSDREPNFQRNPSLDGSTLSSFSNVSLSCFLLSDNERSLPSKDLNKTLPSQNKVIARSSSINVFPMTLEPNLFSRPLNNCIPSCSVEENEKITMEDLESQDEFIPLDVVWSRPLLVDISRSEYSGIVDGIVGDGGRESRKKREFLKKKFGKLLAVFKGNRGGRSNEDDNGRRKFLPGWMRKRKRSREEQ